MVEAKFSFADLMERVLAGCPESTRRLLDTYGPHILRAVRRNLHFKLRSKYDSIDFVQDVWASFFRDLPRRVTFACENDLVAFLTTMARNKVAETVRARMIRPTHNINREQPLENGGNRGDAIDLLQATPSEEMMSKEAWEDKFKNLFPAYRPVILQWLEGKTTKEIAEDLHISTKTVYRALKQAFGRKSHDQ